VGPSFKTFREGRRRHSLPFIKRRGGEKELGWKQVPSSSGEGGVRSLFLRGGSDLLKRGGGARLRKEDVFFLHWGKTANVKKVKGGGKTYSTPAEEKERGRQKTSPRENRVKKKGKGGLPTLKGERGAASVLFFLTMVEKAENRGQAKKGKERP